VTTTTLLVIDHHQVVHSGNIDPLGESGELGAFMTITIRMEGEGADEELQSLYDWLLSDPTVRRSAQVSLRSATPKPGEMGATLDAIQVVLDQGMQAGGLLLTYLTWRATRTNKVNGTIERGNTEVPLSEATTETAESVAKKLDTGES
jgi:hypothetical protein